MQIFDIFGEELFVDDLVARAYSSGYAARMELVYIDKIPEAPGKRLRVRDAQPNKHNGLHYTSNIEYNPNRMVKIDPSRLK